jgi:putative membrane protein
MRLLATLSSIVVLLTAPATAQPGNPAGMAPLTPQEAPGKPAPHQPNQADRLFVRQAAMGGLAEVELGKLAAQKGQSDAVKDFARLMIEDHVKANERLSALAEQAGLTPPKEIDQEHRAVRDRLEKLSGAEFDRAYIQSQLQDHQKTAQLLEWEIGSAQDPALKSFAAETLPVVLRHLRRAQEIAAELTGGAS